LQLKELRNQLAREENVPAYIIFSDATLQELATYLPGEVEELKQSSGFGEVKIQRYGAPFLEKVVAYKREYGLTSKIAQKRPKRVKKPKKEITTNPKLESLHLFQKGKSVEEIVQIRQLSSNTIENHLAHFILEGTLKIHKMVSDEKISWITQAIQKHGDIALSPIKNELGEKVSYGEIRMVISHLKRKNQ
jgi:ATP-dependent DNA helicase RecQ